MAEATHEEVHRHPAPTGFIRKYIFSIDHKVIGTHTRFMIPTSP